ncbi:MAG: DUF1236 domain-containing protein [Alphaproteobacteria bacterium]|nr:DUF1236 domain-containing protein [Alphaproteobacteria bacterium]
MKPIVAAAAVVLLASPAFAQVTERTTTTTTTIAPAEETQMREYIIKEHRAAIPPPTDFEVTTGAVVPQSVELYSFPAEHHWRYDYATFGDRTVLVDPDTRRVVTVLH